MSCRCSPRQRAASAARSRDRGLTNSNSISCARRAQNTRSPSSKIAIRPDAMQRARQLAHTCKSKIQHLSGSSSSPLAYAGALDVHPESTKNNPDLTQAEVPRSAIENSASVDVWTSVQRLPCAVHSPQVGPYARLQQPSLHSVGSENLPVKLASQKLCRYKERCHTSAATAYPAQLHRQLAVNLPFRGDQSPRTLHGRHDPA